MDISAEKGFKILASAIQDYTRNVSLKLQSEATELEGSGWPEGPTEEFRVKITFFHEYLEGQAKAIKNAMEDLTVSRINKALSDINYSG